MNSTQTLRFDVKIDKNNSENYEISFFDLIKIYTPQEHSEGFDEEHNKRLKYVKQIEAKYGPVAVVKGKRIRVNDFVDQGNGYDIDDPFIDDSGGDEALVVAPDLMTEHGGFFINKESLKLNEGNFVIERVEGGNDLMDLPKQAFPQKKNNKKSKSQKLLCQARKRLTTSLKSNSSMRRISSNCNEKLDEIINDVVSINNIPEAVKDENTPKCVKKSECSDAQVPNVAQEKETNNAQVCNVVSVAPTKVLDLPVGLPDGALEKIRLLSDITETCKIDGKRIEPQFDALLLELDILLHVKQKGSKSLRTNTLRYVGQITNIKYEAILRRLLKLKESKRQQKLKPLFTALEDEIKQVMVESVSKYEHAMKVHSSKVEAQRLSAQSLAVTDDSFNCLVDQIIEKDPDCKVKPLSKFKTPKRTFKWSLACKSLLYQLVSGHLEEFQASNNKAVPEEYLNKFFQTSVINLFPPKWMTVSQLVKITLPIMTEFKQCIVDGKEFKCAKIEIKPKPEQKPNNNQNGASVSMPKEAVATLNKCQATTDLTDSKTKPLICPVKKSILQTKTIPSAHINPETTKPQAIVHSLNKTPKTSAVQVNLKPKPLARSSTVMSPKSYQNATSGLTLQSQDAVKRHSDGSLVLSPTSVLPNRVPDLHGFNLIGMPPLNSHSDPSLSCFPNYLYSHNNNYSEKSCRNNISNAVSVNNLLPHCSQQVSQQPQLQQQQQPNPFQQQLQHQMQHHNTLGNDFVHSTPYINGPDNISRLQHRQQKVPDLSTIFSNPVEIRPSDHHQQPLLINSQHTTTNQNNVHQQIHHQIASIMSDFEKQQQGLYFSNAANNQPIIDLTGDSPISTIAYTQQVSPSKYLNLNTAQCPNQKNFQS